LSGAALRGLARRQLRAGLPARPPEPAGHGPL